MVNVRRMSRQQWNKLPKLKFQNVAKDFSVTVAFIKKTPSGALRILHETGMSPTSVSYIMRFAKDQGDKYMFSEGGSAFNVYVLKKKIS
jgi:hypothetical protein